MRRTHEPPRDSPRPPARGAAGSSVTRAGKDRGGKPTTVGQLDDADLVADHAAQTAALGSHRHLAGESRRQTVAGDLGGHQPPEPAARARRSGLIAPDQAEQPRHVRGGRRKAARGLERLSGRDPLVNARTVARRVRYRVRQLPPAGKARVRSNRAKEILQRARKSGVGQSEVAKGPVDARRPWPDRRYISDTQPVSTASLGKSVLKRAHGPECCSHRFSER